MNLRSRNSKATKNSETKAASQLRQQSEDRVKPRTPQSKQRGSRDPPDDFPSDLLLNDVPDEVLVQIITRLGDISSLCVLARVSKRWQSLVEVS